MSMCTIPVENRALCLSFHINAFIPHMSPESAQSVPHCLARVSHSTYVTEPKLILLTSMAAHTKLRDDAGERNSEKGLI